MLDRFDFIRDIRLRGKPAIIGLVLLGVLGLSVLLFLLVGNGQVSRILYFPTQGGHRLVAEQRFVPRHRGIASDVTELVEGMLLGPTRHDAVRLFPRGGRVISAMVSGRTLYLDLASQVLVDDPEVPIKGQEALNALARTIRLNFPGLKQVVFFVDGQQPHFPKKI